MITQPINAKEPTQLAYDSSPLQSLDAEAFRDWAWTNEQLRAGAFVPYQGEHVVVLHQKVVGHGGDGVDLLDRISKETSLPKNRFIIRYVESPDSL